jgi:transaldolase/glucose-6-phosphate isomerase
MSENPLRRIHTFGQSIWLDFIRRSLLKSGDLKSMVERDGIRGVTSNPSIFEKAISGSHDYDELIRARAKAGISVEEIYQELTIEDVQEAADIFLPLYEETNGLDGYVSLEVSPHLAHDTQGTIAEARRLWSALDRPNVLIKVPATLEGLPAIKTLIAEGINVNVTLLFSLPRYRKVAEAYLEGLETRLAQGSPIDRVASVASFFISRIDVLIDPELEKVIKSDGEHAELAAKAHGQVAISCAREAYQIFEEIFSSSRFNLLAENGAGKQRLLWASTSTKDPRYSDVKYVEALIGSETVNTIPLETLNAYRDHGDPGLRIEQDLISSRRILDSLPNMGIDLKQATEQLEHEGVHKFSRSFDRLMASIEKKRGFAGEDDEQGMHINFGKYETAYRARLQKLANADVAKRIWDKDPGLWTDDQDEHAQIKHALGWLHVVEKMKHNLSALKQFSDEVVEAGFNRVVHMGMGGSSLAPMLFAHLFQGLKSGLPVTILDSTDPESILGLEKKLALEKTLFIVASKSGETAETLAFGDYFYNKVHDLKGDDAGENFVAITDPGSHLVEIANARRFRKVFLNYTDIGGRYSALSYFGLVPAALGGVDVEELLERAAVMMHACNASVPVDENPGLRLGAALGELAQQGRDKITFVMPDTLSTLGMWLEQLLAESTGKEGEGLLPVQGEQLGDLEVYGSDRVFVDVYLEEGKREGLPILKRLEKAGHPIIHIMMKDQLDVGMEFFRWEFATAVAGSIIGINAFNQPNVQESKDNTERLLDQFDQNGTLPEEEPHLTEADMQIFSEYVTGDLEVTISEFLLDSARGDYLALMAFLPEKPEMDRELQKIRLMLRDRLKLATTLGYGPRFLHSTGQLHKGGPNSGLFLQLTADHTADADIPGRSYSFGVLQHAQYLGDFEALQEHGRRVIRIHLGTNPVAKLKRLEHFLDVGVKSLPLAYRAAHESRRQGEKVAR